MKLKHLRVAHKLWLLFLGQLFLLVAVTVWTQWRSQQVTDAAQLQIQKYEHAIQIAMRWHGIARLVGTMANASVNSTDEDLIQKFEKQEKELIVTLKSLQEESLKNASTSADVVALEKIKANNQPRLPTYFKLIEAFVNLQVEQRDEAVQSYRDARAYVTNTAVIITLLVIVLGVAMVVLLVRSITQSLSKAVSITQGIASGDLTQDTNEDSKDEFGDLARALSSMATNLRDIVANVRDSVESVSTASAEIAQGNNDLSTRTEQQASSLEETSTSMEELSSTVKQNADNARLANQFAQEASTVAARGGQVVSEVVDTMKSINDSSRKISDIISVIDGIAFQTNILALNAAVEAARAGEHGRGFAVVASEVRSLAGRSADAAKEIKALINASVERVVRGSELVDEAGTTMTEVVGSIRKVSDLMGEISSASSEQSAGVIHVGYAVNSMEQATQQNAALVEEIAAAASSLKSQAQALVSAVAVFKVTSEKTDIQMNSSKSPIPMNYGETQKSEPKPRSALMLKPVIGKKLVSVSVGKAGANVHNATKTNSDAWETF